jgi:hypothetical protein
MKKIKLKNIFLNFNNFEINYVKLVYFMLSIKIFYHFFDRAFSYLLNIIHTFHNIIASSFYYSSNILDIKYPLKNIFESNN